LTGKLSSCPDWATLIAVRSRLVGADPEGWEIALAHLDGCHPCRRRAESLDPLLAFRRLPRVEVSPDAVEDMRHRVAVLRGARQVDRPAAPPRSRWSAAAATFLLVAGLLMAAGHEPARVGEAAVAEASSEHETLVAGFLVELANQPVLEHLDQPFEQVVQWSSEELSMILLLDV
jgi:hypothetical protein